MDKIVAQVQSWELLTKLPGNLEGFTLRMELKEQGTRYCIFTYENKECYKGFSILYDKATKEFLARIVVGLTEYFDVNFIVGDIMILEKLLLARLKDTLHNLAEFNQDTLDSILIDKKILEWPYNDTLVKESSGFTLFIKPCQPVKIINGSYIIIDYSDFSSESSLVIYYNIFRDEFFGELRFKKTPEMINIFDSKEVMELEEKIKLNLSSTLKKMRSRIEGNNG